MSDESHSDTVDNIPLGRGSPPVGVDIAGRTDRGKVRPNNEDNFHVVQFGRQLRTVASSLPPSHAPDDFDQSGYGFAVADGVGGHAAGEVASRLALVLLVDLVVRTPDWLFASEDYHLATVMDRIARRFGKVNEAVVPEARARRGLAGMGTTLSLAVSLGNDLIVAHVGDSPVFLFRGGRLERLTRDHVVPLAGPKVPTADATRFRLALSHAIGMPDTGGSPDIIRLKLADRDRLLLCTDGLTDLVSDDDIADELGRASADDACQALVDRALARGGHDNVTVVVAGYRFAAG
jgi:protein phosphatase